MKSSLFLLLALGLWGLPARADPEPHLQAGLEHLARGRLPEAVVEFRVARALGAKGGTAEYLGTALVQRGRPEEAVEFFEAATTEAPEARDALFHHAHALACHRARLYHCALRLLGGEEEGLSPLMVAQRAKLRAELEALLRTAPREESLDWYHRRATESLASGRPVLAAAQAAEAEALALLRADRYRLGEAKRLRARALQQSRGAASGSRRPAPAPRHLPGGDDPCAPPPARQSLAPEVASAYLAAGEWERGAGDGGAASFAYRQALRHGAPPEPARAALAELCTQARAPDLLAEGLERMRRGELREALAAFSAVRAREPSASAALLEALCHYELGEDARARPLLLEAREEPSLTDSADLYLGLIALRQGAHAEAASYFEAVGASGDAALARTARDMQQLARSEGPLLVVAHFETGYDSNLTLAPASPVRRGGGEDGAGALSLTALARPFGASGLYARAEGSYRKQLQFDAFDTGSLGAAVGWRLGNGARHATLEYGYDVLLFGGAAYLSAHRVSASARLPLGDVALRASYSGRQGHFLRSDVQGYSGLRHAGEGGLSVRLGANAWVGASYLAVRDLAESAPLAHLEHGPRAELGLRLGAPLQLFVRGGVLWRGFDAVDPGLGVVRQEQVLDGGLTLELALSSRWSARAFLGGQRAHSTVSSLRFQQLVGSLGFSYVLSAP